jgi:hypothetical protein
MRKLALIGVVVAALAAAGSAQAIKLSKLPPMPPGSWHATINVVINRQPHTLVYDRGQVTAVTPTSYTVKERDGSMVTINVAPTTKITIQGQPSSVSQMRPLEQATSVSIDGGPAARVTVKIPPAVAALWRREAGRGGAGQ